MATPKEYALSMLDFAGIHISRMVREQIDPSKRLLDIGAGWGKYRWLLPEYEMDALDIWEPYVKKHKLDAYYRNVHISDGSKFVYPDRYAGIIMGDVLEHLTVEDAQTMVKNACDNADYVYIATPYVMEQEEVENNPHEAHIQDDLTCAIMEKRYPELVLAGVYGRRGEHTKAIYVKRGLK